MARHPGQESHRSLGTHTQTLEQARRHVDTRVAPIEIAMLRRFSRGRCVTRLMGDREQVIENTQVSANAHRCGRANKK
jgi:hypothetical protein